MESNEAINSAAEVTAEVTMTETATITSPPPLQDTPAKPMVPVAALPSSTTEAGTEEPEKKKRGRLRKHAPDGSVLMRPSTATTAPLNPMPISSSMPAGEIPAAVMKERNRGRPAGYLSSIPSSSSKMHHTSRVDFESPCNFTGTMLACTAGANFTPHIISVAAGEGHFELLSLSGSFMPTDGGGSRNRSGGMSVSLASPDGRVIGGGVVGILVAASPVQVIVGSFLPSYETEHETKKPRYETTPISMPAIVPNLHTDNDYDTNFQSQHSTVSTPKPSLAPFPSFRAENNWTAPPHSVPESRSNSSTDINLSLPTS